MLIYPMKLCLLLHCLCESYKDIPDECNELFVSVEDVNQLADQLKSRNYQFTLFDDPTPNTITFTFDDGYYNNFLFENIANAYNIPFLVFISAYYNQSGINFPWFVPQIHKSYTTPSVNYYTNIDEISNPSYRSTPDDDNVRPFTPHELRTFINNNNVEIGCHGYYHQALSKRFQEHIISERDKCVTFIQAELGLRPNYFALPNGVYTKRVVKTLLESFDKVLTSDGIPFKTTNRVIHRLNLSNPNISGPLIDQIDRHISLIRRAKRTIHIRKNLWL